MLLLAPFGRSAATKGDLGKIPGERHNEDEIHLKALPEQIFVVFFQIDKSRTTKEQFHSDQALILNESTKKLVPQYRRQRSSLTERGESHAACSCLSECQNVWDNLDTLQRV